MTAVLNENTTASAVEPTLASSFVNLPELTRRAFLLAHISPITTSKALMTAKKVKSSVLPASPGLLRLFNSRKAPAADVEEAKNVAIPVLFRIITGPTSGIRLATPNNLSNNGCKTCQPPIVTPQNAGNRWSSKDLLKISRI